MRDHLAAPSASAALLAALDSSEQSFRQVAAAAEAVAGIPAMQRARAVAAQARVIRLALLPEQARLPAIIEIVAAEFGVPPEAILSVRRQHELVMARWTVIRLARAAGLSLSAIGRGLALNHATVAHALAQMDQRIGGAA